MLLNDEELSKRLNSPMNLMNKLKETNKSKKAKEAMSIFIPPARPFTEMKIKDTEKEAHPSLDEILANNESQIKLGLAHDRSLNLLAASVELLSNKLDDVRADRLPSVIAAASKVVESIRRERNEASKNNKDREVHYHFYTPEQRKVSDYEVIDVQ
jgi:hypothetical protein